MTIKVPLPPAYNAREIDLIHVVDDYGNELCYLRMDKINELVKTEEKMKRMKVEILKGGNDGM